MSIFIEEEGAVTLPVDCEGIAKKVIDTVLDYLKCPYETEVNLLLTTDEDIREMNEMYRKIDHATDVLSFPMLEYREPADFESAIQSEDSFNPDSGELMLGDIVISKDHVLKQAKSFGHSVKREYAFLIAHSMLHLCGYDHIEDGDRILMEKKQKSVMKRVNILR